MGYAGLEAMRSSLAKMSDSESLYMSDKGTLNGAGFFGRLFRSCESFQNANNAFFGSLADKYGGPMKSALLKMAAARNEFGLTVGTAKEILGFCAVLDETGVADKLKSIKNQNVAKVCAEALLSRVGGYSADTGKNTGGVVDKGGCSVALWLADCLKDVDLTDDQAKKLVNSFSQPGLPLEDEDDVLDVCLKVIPGLDPFTPAISEDEDFELRNDFSTENLREPSSPELFAEIGKDDFSFKSDDVLGGQFMEQEQGEFDDDLNVLNQLKVSQPNVSQPKVSKPVYGTFEYLAQMSEREIKESDFDIDQLESFILTLRNQSIKRGGQPVGDSLKFFVEDYSGKIADKMVNAESEVDFDVLQKLLMGDKLKLATIRDEIENLKSLKNNNELTQSRQDEVREKIANAILQSAEESPSGSLEGLLNMSKEELKAIDEKTGLVFAALLNKRLAAAENGSKTFTAQLIKDTLEVLTKRPEQDPQKV